MLKKDECKEIIILFIILFQNFKNINSFYSESLSENHQKHCQSEFSSSIHK